MHIKSATYQVAIVICVELWGKNSRACLLLIAKRYSGEGWQQHMGIIFLISIPAPFPGRTDISNGSEFIFKMTCCLHGSLPSLFS